MTTPPVVAEVTAPPPSPSSLATKQLRGSTLLLSGRLLSMLINVVVQVLIVRYLSRSDFGAFAYALSFVTLGETVVTLGLDNAVSRFVPLYQERLKPGKVLGTLVVVGATVGSLSLALVVLTYGLQGVITGRVITDADAAALLLILVFLAPLHALDTLSVGLFAVYAQPRAIFLRRYVMAPGLRLAVVGLLALGGHGVAFLATGYVVTGAVATAGFGFVLWRVLRKGGVFSPPARSQLQLPFREIFGFALPLLTTDLVYAVMHLSDVMLLGWYSGTSEVAAFRAVQPAAKLNLIVLSSFALLFTPLSARLFARGDHTGLGQLYRQSAVWVAVLTFPVLALTTGLAGPLTQILFGARYADAAIYMALLAAGSYVQAAAGFNGLTLRAYGSVRTIVTLNLFAAGVNLALNVLLIPRFGALGAAIGTLIALVLHNVLKQAGLRRVSGIRLFAEGTTRVYATAFAAIVVLTVIVRVATPPTAAAVGLAALASAAVLLVGRPLLAVDVVFPELLRFRVLRWLLGRR